MSPGNRDGNARRELARAREALRAAEVLLDAAMWADATSRAYYAAFHASKALLFHVGVQARSHAGVRHLMGLYYVKAGILSPRDARTVTRLAKEREAADYGTGRAMAVRVRLRLTPRIPANDGSLEAIDLINSGYEARRTELILPPSLALDTQTVRH